MLSMINEAKRILRMNWLRYATMHAALLQPRRKLCAYLEVSVLTIWLRAIDDMVVCTGATNL